MKKIDFLNELEKRLKVLPADDRSDALYYFNEYLEDMGLTDNDDVSNVFESPKDVAGKIIEECRIKHIAEHPVNKSVKNNATIIWLSILGILSLPISVPAVAVIFVIALCLLIFVGAIILSLAVCGIAMGFTGFVCLLVSFFTGSFGQSLVLFGTGLILIAVAILIIIGLISLIRLLGFVFSKIFGKKRVK